MAPLLSTIDSAFASDSSVQGIGMQYSSNPDMSPLALHVDVKCLINVEELIPPLASIKPVLQVKT